MFMSLAVVWLQVGIYGIEIDVLYQNVLALHRMHIENGYLKCSELWGDEWAKKIKVKAAQTVSIKHNYQRDAIDNEVILKPSKR